MGFTWMLPRRRRDFLFLQGALYRDVGVKKRFAGGGGTISKAALMSSLQVIVDKPLTHDHDEMVKVTNVRK